MAENASTTLIGKQAVVESLGKHPAIQAILGGDEAALSNAFTDALFDRGELSLTIDRGQIVAATRAVQKAGYNFFEDMTAIDWYPRAPRFQLSYHILSHSFKERIRLRAFVDEADPCIDSITAVWPSANYYEREVFDLFGIQFHNHPNLRRILMPDDWQGYPLRKDYPVEGYR
jgi:NADH-quinone oxidoreductase subunit C